MMTNPCGFQEVSFKVKCPYTYCYGFLPRARVLEPTGRRSAHDFRQDVPTMVWSTPSQWKLELLLPVLGQWNGAKPPGKVNLSLQASLHQSNGLRPWPRMLATRFSTWIGAGMSGRRVAKSISVQILSSKFFLIFAGSFNWQWPCEECQKPSPFLGDPPHYYGDNEVHMCPSIALEAANPADWAKHGFKTTHGRKMAKRILPKGQVPNAEDSSLGSPARICRAITSGGWQGSPVSVAWMLWLRCQFGSVCLRDELVKYVFLYVLSHFAWVKARSIVWGAEFVSAPNSIAYEVVYFTTLDLRWFHKQLLRM